MRKVKESWEKFLAYDWTPAKAGVVIGFAVLLSYFFYDSLGMCVGCFIGDTLSYIEHKLFTSAIFFRAIPTNFRTPIIGMFLGSFLAAYLSKEFWIRKVKLSTVLMSFLAGILIGFGNFLASGCPVRHMIVGFPALLLDSWVAVIGIILGIYLGAQFLRWWSER
jgi:uncharacterized membrane protein YedE/YeeE